MTDKEPDNLVLEILRRIQGDLSILKDGQGDLKSELIGIRKQLHAMQGDSLRQEQTIAGLRLEVDRINTRLDLSDA